MISPQFARIIIDPEVEHSPLATSIRKNANGVAVSVEVLALPVLKPCEALSINTFEDLRRVEDEMRKLGY